MKKFKFRYESILKMKHDIEDKIKNELSQLFAHKRELDEQLDLLCHKEQVYQSYIQNILITGGSSSKMHGFYEGKKYYIDHKNEITQKIKSVELSIHSTQIHLVEAMKERKIMEKLKEKAFQEFIDMYNEADAKLIEEVVNYNNSLKEGN